VQGERGGAGIAEPFHFPASRWGGRPHLQGKKWTLNKQWKRIGRTLAKESLEKAQLDFQCSCAPLHGRQCRNFVHHGARALSRRIEKGLLGRVAKVSKPGRAAGSNTPRCRILGPKGKNSVGGASPSEPPGSNKKKAKTVSSRKTRTTRRRRSAPRRNGDGKNEVTGGGAASCRGTLKKQTSQTKPDLQRERKRGSATGPPRPPRRKKHREQQRWPPS